MWITKGLKKLGDLFKGQVSQSFDQGHQRFGLINQGDFYSCLQMRDFIVKDPPMADSSPSGVERALSLEIGRKGSLVFTEP